MNQIEKHDGTNCTNVSNDKARDRWVSDSVAESQGSKLFFFLPAASRSNRYEYEVPQG